MKRDQVFIGSQERASDFEFDAAVAEAFDHMVMRSENVLVPYRMEENLELFRRNGFEIAETFFQWFNFAGFLCVKKPRPAAPPAESN